MNHTVIHRLSSLLICVLLSACGSDSAREEHPMPPIQPGPDPLLAQQWHLDNSGQSGGRIGADINVTPVWASCTDGSCRGEGVRIAVVDDGLEVRHPDLWMNVIREASYNYLSGSWDPTPRESARNASHGTAVAGLAAARDFNSEGGRGVAPRAQLVGYNLLKAPTTANEANAMVRGRQSIAVSTNSWGATDRTGQMQPASFTWQEAIELGLREGRGGRGIVYVWAAGNGHAEETSNGLSFARDNSNYDGRANYHGVMAIAALGHDGVKAGYSEEGANLWLAAPGGGGSCSGNLITTDLTGEAGLNSGVNANDLPDTLDYTRCMGGTSAATPLVAGVAALVLQVRPELTWRDVRVILALSARQTDADDDDWQPNGRGYLVNHKYGFGLVDAEAAVELARSWPLLPPQRVIEAEGQPQNPVIPDNNPTGLNGTITISGSGINSIEWVDIEFASTHTYAGDLTITLTSPSGTESRLAERHLCQGADCTGSITDPDGTWRWRFGSARHLGEAADGLWTLQVTDTATTERNPGVGEWLSWRLTLRGH